MLGWETDINRKHFKTEWLVFPECTNQHQIESEKWSYINTFFNFSCHNNHQVHTKKFELDMNRQGATCKPWL